jgi:hypothetical protein
MEEAKMSGDWTSPLKSLREEGGLWDGLGT